MNKKDVQPELVPEDEKVISIRRIAVASIICIVVVSGLIWGILRVSELIYTTGNDVLGTNSAEIPDSVRLPNTGDFERVSDGAKEIINGVSLEDITSSTSGVHKIIKTMQELQASDSGVEDYFCSLFCK